MKHHYTYDMPPGRITICADGERVTNINTGAKAAKAIKNSTEKETDMIKTAAAQLAEYFAGERRAFDLPLALAGTPFQQKVWSALCDIPYGHTRSYKQIAEAVGNPGASRAVGMANNRNPVMIVVPCHRVIGASGKLVGYASGLDIKQGLLELEKK